MKRLLIYVSGLMPEGGQATQETIHTNVRLACFYAYKIMVMTGHTVFVPHLYWFLENTREGLTYDDWMIHDLNALSRCDALFILPGQGYSKGVRQEYIEALRLGKPIYYAINMIPRYGEGL